MILLIRYVADGQLARGDEIEGMLVQAKVDVAPRCGCCQSWHGCVAILIHGGQWEER